MILCSCFRIRCKHVKDLIEKEGITVDEALIKLGCGEACGTCKENCENIKRQLEENE